MKKILYLIDGTAYIHRAYHAIRGLTNSSGLPTNAVLGFTKMLVRLMEDKKPEYIAMFFDAKGKTFRHDIYNDYKANRPAMPEDMAVQIPYIREIAQGFNMPVIEMPGYEADDLIGTVADMAEKAGFSVVMVTGDKDFLQLVTDAAIIWDPLKEKINDINTIRETFGVDPQQMTDVMGLSGDTSDNIPGVPGIGQKTALSLIQKFGSMEKLYERISEITKKKQHENLVKYKDQAFLSRKLVKIDKAVPLAFEPEKFKRKDPDAARLSDLFKTLEFSQFLKIFPQPSDLSQKRYKGIYDMEALSELIAQLEASEVFALDTETTSQYPMKAKLVGLSFSLKPNEAFYIPCAHDYLGVPLQLRLSDVLEHLRPLLENPNIGKIGQNIKYDWMVLARHGIHLRGVVSDTMIASYLLNPSKRAHNLDRIALDFLDHKKISYEEVVGKKTFPFSQVPVEKAVPYACEDADITLMAHHVLRPQLETLGLTSLLEKVEMPLVPVLMKMEMQGICVDRQRLRDLSKSFEHQLEKLEDKIYAIAGEKFNIKSSQQLGHILFEKLKLPVQKKTKKKTGYSTDVDVLTTLAENHELPAFILRHRTLAKLKSTYTDALVKLVNPETGRIHTSYNQTVTATGRLSSSDPNLQNIPIRDEEGRAIRSAFVPREGWSLLAADYSQIELRILAHCSDDKILLQSFNENEDIHTRTATEVFQISHDAVTPELRRQAKAINFGIIYGMGAYSLSKELGITRKMAKTYIENYFSKYKGVKQFTDQTIEDAKKTRQTSTLLGRIRLLPDINSANRNIRGFAERIAINTPIQGTAADLIKVAMINVNAAFEEKKLKSAMLLSVHDELVFEVPPDELDMVKKLVRDIMEGVWELNVPLKVNMECGENWAEAH
ncbi:DNA polymerase I [Desulfonema magnum]|uniref:DNA polymerase I n=1 Tax=Desulfonema magnum TaxID=45655 RepID=A0A975GSF2_9BACT|nr:DNA polymerase I [Desulfonema magnum]QTA92006.1 DNA polymerase I [Desulfonema magnum]